MSRNKCKYNYLPLILRVLKEHKSLVHFSFDSEVSPIIKNVRYKTFLAACKSPHEVHYAILMGIERAKLRSNVFYGYLSEFSYLLTNNKHTSKNIENVEERTKLFYSVLPMNEKVLISHPNNKSYKVSITAQLRLWMKKIMRNT